jgi:hypothetical protein
MKAGVLSKNTYLHTGNLVVKVRRGTEVHAEGRVLTFPSEEGLKVIRHDGIYYALLWGSVRIINLPNGGRPPFPLSMIY